MIHVAFGMSNLFSKFAGTAMLSIELSGEPLETYLCVLDL